MPPMMNPLRQILARRQPGRPGGIPSYCTGNELVLEILLRRAKVSHTPVLLEATANQSNQFGGYTGLRPGDYCDRVLGMARRLGVPEELVILGGDHLGPLTWQDRPEAEAMALAEELVYQYARAGFTKIHLDTSMKVADDPAGPLSTETVARRGVRLYQVCMRAYQDRLAQVPDAPRPVFVIGSEVPIPGGAQEAEDSLAVTRPEDFANTVDTYRRCFAEAGVPAGWEDVIAVVVQPGVEFGDDQVFLYDRSKASGLCSRLRDYPQLVFEGHSTDYQTAGALREMTEDGIAILKVGPALTFGLREALFSLSMMERELVPAGEQADLPGALEQAMLARPGHWINHYHGSDEQLRLARKYSFSDRSRYYIGGLGDRVELLFENLRRHPIPSNMLHQYMPLQFQAVRRGELDRDPRELALYGAALVAMDYEYAAGQAEA